MKKLKFDREWLLKNRFWLLLAVIPVFWFIAWLVLVTGVAEERDLKKKAYADVLNGHKTMPNPKNASYIQPLQDKEKTLQDHKNTVWKEVWKSQEDMMTWPWAPRTHELRLLHFASRPESERPPEAREELKRREIGYFGDPIPDLERREYAYNGLYASQLEEFKEPPRPVHYYGGWERLIQPVLKFKADSPPTTEECWLAQEDLWVKRELLRMVKAALDAVALFEDAAVLKVVKHEAGSDANLPSGVEARQLCRNAHWELELLVEEQKKPESDGKEPAGAKDKKPDAAEAAEKKPVLVLSPKSKLKNIIADKRPLSLEELKLRLLQRDARGQLKTQVEFTVKKDKVEWDKSVELGQAVALGNLNAREPIEVEVVADKSDPLPKGVQARQRFRNPSWELELLVEENDKKQLVISPRSKIRNIHPNQRTLNLNGVQFLVRQKDQAPVTLRIQGEPLPWGQSAEIKDSARIDSFNVKRPFQLEQVLDWSTSPIKRIDDIRLGYHSHRTAVEPLKHKAIGTPPESIVASSGESGEGSQPAPVGGKTPNGLERSRYYDVTGQVRRLPLGMVLIVDQAHVQDVLTAFSNSRLRIQPTQVHFDHVRGISPPTPEEREGTKPETGETPVRPPIKFPFTPGRGPTPGAPPREGIGIGGKPFFPPGHHGAELNRATPDEDPNVVRLAIYGVASLYERHPPKAASSGSASPAP